MKTKIKNTCLPFILSFCFCLIFLSFNSSFGQKKKASVKKHNFPFGIYTILKQFDNNKFVELNNSNAQIDFDIKTGKIYATVGCNKLTGRYATGRKNSMKFNSITSTKMACSDQNETIFLRNLSIVNRYEINRDDLFLYNGKKIIVQLQKQQKKVSKPNENMEGVYQLEDLFKAGKSMSGNFEKTKITIQDGRISCNVGCNSISGNFESEENKIKPMQLMMTEMYCEKVAELEQTFTRNLELVNRYSLINGKLEMYQDHVKLMVLKKKDE